MTYHSAGRSAHALLPQGRPGQQVCCCTGIAKTVLVGPVTKPNPWLEGPLVLS